MALTAVVDVEVADTLNVTSYATGSFTPGANKLMLAFVQSVGGPESAAAVSGNGVTYSKVGAGLTWGGTNVYHIDLWVGNSGATPSAGAVTSSGWGTNRTGCIQRIIEITGHNTGVTPVQAIIQTPSASGLAATTGSLSFAAPHAAVNRPIASLGHQAAETTLTNPTSWSLLSNAQHGTPPSSMRSFWRSDAFDLGPITATWASTVDWGILGAEISEATDVSTGPFDNVASDADYWYNIRANNDRIEARKMRRAHRRRRAS